VDVLQELRLGDRRIPRGPGPASARGGGDKMVQGHGKEGEHGDAHRSPSRPLPSHPAHCGRISPPRRGGGIRGWVRDPPPTPGERGGEGGHGAWGTMQQLMSPLRAIPSRVRLCTPPNSCSRMPPGPRRATRHPFHVGFVSFCVWGDIFSHRNRETNCCKFADWPRAPFLMSQSAPAHVHEMGECTGAGGGFRGGGESHRW